MEPRALTEGGIGKRAAQSLERFLALESAGGILLIFASLVAIICANSGLHDLYEGLLHLHLTIGLGDTVFDEPLHFWVNDGLMAVFFLLVGMEIKREMMEGHLASIRQSLLPFVAAAGGMLVPGLIYWHFNAGLPTLRGWAIPTATDIAFALGILALFGSRVPLGLKVFLTAVAVIDDLGAVIIIALFYTADLNVPALLQAAGLLVILLFMNIRGMGKLWLYLLVGACLWKAVLSSGIHATIAGVLLGFCIPLKCAGERSPLRRLEHTLLPWVTYGILPLFAFFNAGIDFRAISLHQLSDPVPLGIALGLFLGKQIGIFTSSGLLMKTGFARLPEHATWREFYGVCILCGIGFTMSLFIAGLAFNDPLLTVETRLGVLLGTLASTLLGYGWLRLAMNTQSPERRVAIANDWAKHREGM
jgi:NhaA family Na+:H+ antiporter